MKLLITGTAGFIGFHTVKQLLDTTKAWDTDFDLTNLEIVGLDNINDYYDLRLKYGRLAECGIALQDIRTDELVQSSQYKNYRFIKTDLTNQQRINSLFSEEQFDVVIHLAAQAGVRYSITNPEAYLQSNMIGFFNILQACREHQVKHLAYASSSSVYGWNEKYPFSTTDNVDHPISLYAASKKSNELLAHSYSALYDLPTTGLRFFTVYGPWGRPDMALFLFTEKILKGIPIDVYNNGQMKRDFTYIDDIVEGVIRVALHPAQPNPQWSGVDPDPGSSRAPYKIYNIGNSQTVLLLDFIKGIEAAVGKKAKMNMMPMQAGDVHVTDADVSDLVENLGYKPATDYRDGIQKFVDWYNDFYHSAKS